MPKPEMRVFIVNVTTPGGDPIRTLNANRVEAAYYKNEDGFTTFKDDQHADVLTVRNDCLVTIERADWATGPMAQAQEILAQAREHGSAEGRVITETSSEHPGGRVTESGFHLRVTSIGSDNAAQETR